jgi:hypothetical protein
MLPIEIVVPPMPITTTISTAPSQIKISFRREAAKENFYLGSRFSINKNYAYGLVPTHAHKTISPFLSASKPGFRTNWFLHRYATQKPIFRNDALLKCLSIIFFCGIIIFPQLAFSDPLTINKTISANEILLSNGQTIVLQGIFGAFDDTPDINSIVFENLPRDRFGRLTAQAFVLDKSGTKKSLAAELVRGGYAFVYPPTGDEPDLAELQKAEQEARIAKRGLWDGARYADLPADDPKKIPTGQFAFVKGKVLEAVRIKDKFYLNFGDDYHHDFTVAIAARDLKHFHTANIDPQSYEGKIVRVRGWVKQDFGPMIAVTHPAQIEVTSDK